MSAVENLAGERTRPEPVRATLRENHPAQGPEGPHLPAGTLWFGSVRVPLTLSVRPLAHRIRTPAGLHVWRLRLPDPSGRPQWRDLPAPLLLAWAEASHLFPLATVVREIEERVAGANGGRE